MQTFQKIKISCLLKIKISFNLLYEKRVKLKKKINVNLLFFYVKTVYFKNINIVKMQILR